MSECGDGLGERVASAALFASLHHATHVTHVQESARSAVRHVDLLLRLGVGRLALFFHMPAKSMPADCKRREGDGLQGSSLFELTRGPRCVTSPLVRSAAVKAKRLPPRPLRGRWDCCTLCEAHFIRATRHETEAIYKTILLGL